MTEWNGRRVLVTGAEGFIGSTLAERLLSEGAEVRALVHYKPYGDKGWLAGREDDIDIQAGDVRDMDRVFTAVRGCEVVFHLAALIGIPYSYLAPESYVQTNVVGTQNVATACLRTDVQRMVQTSTSETYGSALRVPIDESHPLQPQSPYSASKIAGDMIALSYYHAFQLPVAVVRPFNTYGPRQTARAVIPTVLAQLHSGAAELHIGSTKPSRDFNYVVDTVDGFLRVATCDRAVGEVVNIGSGREVTIAELITMLGEVTGVHPAIVSDEDRVRPRESEVERLLCDNTRAREWAGWRPTVTLEEGLRRTSGWVAANIQLFDTQRYQV